MLKRKTSGAWNNVSTLKKKVNGAFSNCSTLKRKYNGSWVDVFFNWFNVAKYQIDSGCVGSINTNSGGSVSIYNYIEYGNNCIVQIAMGKFNAVAGDTISIDYSYNLRPYATGSAQTYASINYNVGVNNSYGNQLNLFFNESAYSEIKSNSGTFNYTFTQAYSNVGVYLYVRAWSIGTSRGAVQATAQFTNIYVNGARINYETAVINQ